MSANETNWRAWVHKANEDLLDIENNLMAQRIPWSAERIVSLIGLCLPPPPAWPSAEDGE